MASRKSLPIETLTPTAASLLGFLLEGPLSGWDLMSKAETTIGDFWNITKSQVYRELESLTRLGYVTQGKVGARARIPFKLTPRGRNAFVEWLSHEPGPLSMRWPVTAHGDAHVAAVLSLGIRFHKMVVEWIDQTLSTLSLGFERN